MLSSAARASGTVVWVFREELEALAAFDPVAFPVRCDAEFGLRGLREGQEFDLGGLRLRVLALTGHTPKGAMPLEPDRGWLFSGDALGNRSFWMQVDGASSLETFAAALEAQLAVLQAVPRLRIFTGHGIGECWQGMDWAEAVLRTTKAIVRGAACGHPAESRWPGTLCLDTPVFPEAITVHDEEHQMVYCEGLADVLHQCYETRRLPSELGVAWAKAPQTMDLTHYNSFTPSL